MNVNGVCLGGGIMWYVHMTARKTRLLEQANILVIKVPSDRTEHRLHNDMLSVHIPSFSYPSYAR